MRDAEREAKAEVALHEYFAMKKPCLLLKLWKAKLVLLTACCASIALTGCIYPPSDFSGPNGYGIACDKSRDCLVLKGEWDGSGDTIIEPEVDRFAMVNQFIIGHVERQTDRFTPSPPPPELPQQPGYFIVDTKTGNQTTGLGKADWNNQLALLGITKPLLQDTSYGADQHTK